jgi:hypothetical protein
MTVRITHKPGIGDWAYGAVVDMDDRRARRLALVGYVVEVKPKPKKETGEADGRAESRHRV